MKKRIKKVLIAYKNLIVFLIIVLVLLIVLIVKNINVSKINTIENSYDFNYVSKIPSVFITSKNKNSNVISGTKINFNAKFYYYGNENYYYKWLVFDNGILKSNFGCMKVFNNSISEKSIIVSDNNRYVGIGIYSNSTCSTMVSKTYSKTFNTSDVVTFSSLSHKSKIVDNNTKIDVTFNIDKPILKKFYYRTNYFKNDSIVKSSSCKKVKSRKLSEELLMNEDFNYLSVDVFLDKSCINRASTYFSDTYILSTVKATSIKIEGVEKIKLNDNVQFGVNTFPKNSLSGINWYSTNKEIAIVNSLGLVMGKKVGNTQICAEILYNNSIKECKKISVIE